MVTSNFAPASMTAFKDPGITQRFILLTVPSVNSESRIPEVELIFDRNKNELMKWFMTINKQLVKKALRADGINTITKLVRNDAEDFILDNIVYQKGNRLETKEVATYFIEHKKKMGEYNEKANTDWGKVIGMALSQFSTRIITRQQYDRYKTSDARGYLNIAIKPTSNKLEPGQE